MTIKYARKIPNAFTNAWHSVIGTSQLKISFIGMNTCEALVKLKPMMTPRINSIGFKPNENFGSSFDKCERGWVNSY
jgi:hypothetical protein